jgi:TonB family protein
MGKVVKYCSSCDEGFAERFAFCPVCGDTLSAYEMNPVNGEAAVREETAPVEAAAADTFYEAAPEPAAADVQAADAVEEEIEAPIEEEEVPPTISIPAAASAASVYASQPVYADEPRAMTVTPEAIDGGYYITVIEEKNSKQRNMLLLGSAVFCLTVALIATVWSIFDKTLDIGAIDDGRLFSAVIVDDPMMTEEVKQEEKKKDKSDGGGGGGGKEEPDPVNQGDLVDQTKNPIRPPDVKVPRLENPSLTLPPPSTEGNMKFAKNFDRWGDPNSKFQGLSNGPGSGGGVGTGVGTGQGRGRGTGTGSGTGSGYGSGNGDGNGDGDGDGDGIGRGGPPPKVEAKTTPLQILSKPKATYTDAARTNNVQGSVRLKITLLASGAVGSITPVTRLPHGLTEQAIAAARQIRFKPKMINGVPQSVVVTFDYGFNIY